MLGPSSKKSRPCLNSADLFAVVEYFGLLSPYTSAMRRGMSLPFAPCTQYSDFPLLPTGIGFKQKARVENVCVD